MDIFIESSKTDQYRDGAWVIIAQPYEVKNLTGDRTIHPT